MLFSTLYTTTDMHVNCFFPFRRILPLYVLQFSISHCSFYFPFDHISMVTANILQFQVQIVLCIVSAILQFQNLSTASVFFVKMSDVDWCLPEGLHDTLVWAQFSLAPPKGCIDVQATVQLQLYLHPSLHLCTYSPAPQIHIEIEKHTIKLDNTNTCHLLFYKKVYW